MSSLNDLLKQSDQNAEQQTAPSVTNDENNTKPKKHPNEDNKFAKTETDTQTETKTPLAEEAPANPNESAEPPRPKRNCGRSGPTSKAGLDRSSQNARKHCATSTAHLLPNESEEGYRIVLARWQDRYPAEEGSNEEQFILELAEAEWLRLRNQRYYNDFLRSMMGTPAYQYEGEDLRRHNLMLRYRGDAERRFYRAFRAIESLYRSNRINEDAAAAKAKAEAKAQAAESAPPNGATPYSNDKPIPELRIICVSNEEIRKSIEAEHPDLPPDYVQPDLDKYFPPDPSAPTG